ncbi:ECF transporter S component [Neobacillus dielmonensis]|uniref:ECF transporter S component n=1 Tax=Neobacillus dielmonensis TaxID=1347369 RepID=UPI0005A80971|nr:ECF transporter S component [Neobacillus dielmonensis]
MRNRGKIISGLALFTALSAAGAMIKVPALIGSVALDAFPALLAAAILGGGAGAVVGALGHLLSAMLGGFPLGPLHFLIAGEMAVLVWIYGELYKRHKLLAGGVFVLGNALIAPVPFIFLMNFGFFIGMVPSLFVGSILNTAIALVLTPRLVSNRFIARGFKQ